MRRIFPYNLRDSEINFHIPKPRTEFGKGSIQYRVAVPWNIISAVFRTQLTLSDFKTLLKGKIIIFSFEALHS